MEAQFYHTPSVEPIGRKPFLKKWINQKPAAHKLDGKRQINLFEDIYRFLFQILEHDNLELAYRFRYTVEAAGAAPFIRRQDQLDRALKRAKNRAYEPLESLLRNISVELGLDYEPAIPSLKISKPLLDEIRKADTDFENSMIPVIQEVADLEIKGTRFAYYANGWNQIPANPSVAVTDEGLPDDPANPSLQDGSAEISPVSSGEDLTKQMLGFQPDVEQQQTLPGSPGVTAESSEQQPLMESPGADAINGDGVDAGAVSFLSEDTSDQNQPGDGKMAKRSVSADKQSESASKSGRRHFFAESFISASNGILRKTSLKSTNYSNNPSITNAGEERYPNLPAEFQSNHEISDAYQRHQSEYPEEEYAADGVDNPETAPAIYHSLAGLKLPASHLKGQEEEPEIQSAADETDLTWKGEQPSRVDSPSYTDVLGQGDRIKRIMREKSDEQSEESREAASGGKTAFQIPPPIYKFKFAYKRSTVTSQGRRYDPGVSLLITRESIERRMESVAKQNHFLVGSAAWQYFQQRKKQPFYRDTTSLIIQPDCINQRIVNIKLPKRHALDISESEMETFKAFDSFFQDANATPNQKNDGSINAFNTDMPYSFMETDTDDSEFIQEIHHRKRAAIFQKSLNHLTGKNTILFDYLSGKIAIDSSDKFEIEKWVRAQHSQPIEMYRAYAESMMQSQTTKIRDIQRIFQSKLKPTDLPSQRVMDIIEQLKKKSERIALDYNHLATILKRKDFLSLDREKGASTFSFSHAYSRYRNWRSTVESPKIQVRLADISNRQPIIPLHSLSRRWHFPNAPLISVRTSSEYRKKHTLPVFDKLLSWKQSFSTSKD